MTSGWRARVPWGAVAGREGCVVAVSAIYDGGRTPDFRRMLRDERQSQNLSIYRSHVRNGAGTVVALGRRTP